MGPGWDWVAGPPHGRISSPSPGLLSPQAKAGVKRCLFFLGHQLLPPRPPRPGGAPAVYCQCSEPRLSGAQLTLLPETAGMQCNSAPSSWVSRANSWEGGRIYPWIGAKNCLAGNPEDPVSPTQNPFPMASAIRPSNTYSVSSKC